MSDDEAPGSRAGGPDDHRMFDEIPAFVWTARTDGSVDFVNRYAEELFGESRASVCARWMKTTHPEDLAKAVKTQLECLETGREFRAEMRYLFPDGSYRWFDVRARPLRDEAGNIVRWLGTSIDIHERRSALRALQDSETRYRLFAESTREGIWVWDAKTDRIEWNDRTHELSGLPPGAFPGTREAFMERVHPDDRQALEDAFLGHLQDRVPYRVECRMKYGQTGNVYRHFVGHGLAEWDENGAPLRMVGGFEDVTDYRQADALLRERLAIIERQAREISELSTPIIEVWEGVVTMPLFGSVDGTRAERMMQVLLEAVTARQCQYAILDLTGAASMDADTAEHVGRLLSAVGLLGARGIVVGIRPEVARTMVELGVDVSSVTMLANLREALLFVMRKDTAAKTGKPRREAR
jgi:PAS domain S-box-containing protein